MRGVSSLLAAGLDIRGLGEFKCLQVGDTLKSEYTKRQGKGSHH